MHTPKTLPPPPPNALASFTYKNPALSIVLNARFARWTKFAYFLVLALFFLFLNVIEFCAAKISKEPGLPLGWTLSLIASSLTWWALAMCLISGLVLNTLHGAVACDGQTMVLTDVRKKAFVFALSDIREVRISILKPRSFRIRPEQSAWHLFRIAPLATLDIESKSGRYRVFRRWEVEELQWLSHVLNLYLGLNEQAPASPELVKLAIDSPGYFGSPWKILIPAFVFVGFGFAIYSGFGLYWGLQSRAWPSVLGHITKSQYEDRHNAVTPEFSYTYEVNGIRYNSDRMSFCGTLKDEDIRDFIRAHPVNSTPAVFYSPSNAGRSTLVNHTTPFAWCNFAFGIMLVLIAFIIFVRMTWTRIAKSRTDKVT